MSLALVRNPDILANMAASSARPFCVGFAAETDNLAAYARDKLKNKKLDLIIANDAAATFGHDDAAVTAYWPGGELSLPAQSKAQLARQLITLVAERCRSSHG